MAKEAIRFFDVHIIGVKPLLMHNGELADPLNPWSKKLKECTGKRKKSDEDHEKIAEIEFKGGLYYDEKIGPYIPGHMLDAALKNGAKKHRLGTIFDSCVSVTADMYPLIYTGPRTPDALWTDKRFVDRRTCGVQTARVIRTRPRFDSWELKFQIRVIPCEVNPDDIQKAVINAGIYGALGDFRPKFGAFDLQDFKEVAAPKARAA